MNFFVNHTGKDVIERLLFVDENRLFVGEKNFLIFLGGNEIVKLFKSKTCIFLNRLYWSAVFQSVRVAPELNHLQALCILCVTIVINYFKTPWGYFTVWSCSETIFFGINLKDVWEIKGEHYQPWIEVVRVGWYKLGVIDSWTKSKNVPMTVECQTIISIWK